MFGQLTLATLISYLGKLWLGILMVQWVVFCFLFWIGLEGWVFGSVMAVGVMFWRGEGSWVQSRARGRLVGLTGFGGFVVGFRAFCGSSGYVLKGQVQSHARVRMVGLMGFGWFVLGFGVCLWAAAAWLGLFKMLRGKYLKVMRVKILSGMWMKLLLCFVMAKLWRGAVLSVDGVYCFRLRLVGLGWWDKKRSDTKLMQNV